jgi:transposase
VAAGLNEAAQEAQERDGRRRYSLIATCEENGVNPYDYLAPVLPRLGTHPVSRIDELLPHRWTPTQPAAPPG